MGTVSDYLRIVNALDPVALAMGEVFAIIPCAPGYCARVGVYIATGPTPAEAVQVLLREMAQVLGSNALVVPLHTTGAQVKRAQILDALAAAFEAVGGRWWEV